MAYDKIKGTHRAEEAVNSIGVAAIVGTVRMTSPTAVCLNVVWMMLAAFAGISMLAYAVRKSRPKAEKRSDATDGCCRRLFAGGGTC